MNNKVYIFNPYLSQSCYIKNEGGSTMIKTTRMLSLLLSGMLLMAAGSGCGKTESAPSASTAGPSSSASAQPSEPAVTGETKRPGIDTSKEVHLIWYLWGDAPSNAESVIEKANAFIKEKINATVDFSFINAGDYDTKVQMIMNSGEEYDLCWTSNWSNNYLNNVSKNAYIPLDDLLEDFPDLKAVLPDYVWDGVRVQGKIYGVANYQLMYDQGGLVFKKELLDKYSIDLSTVKTAGDLTPVFQTIKDNEPDIIPLESGNVGFSKRAESGYAYFDLSPYAVNLKTGEVFNKWFSDELQREAAVQHREWYLKGFFPSDVATLKDTTPLKKAGRLFAWYSRQKPGNEAELKQLYGYDVVQLPTTNMETGQGSILSTINAISQTSKNPERAMALLELVNTRPELFNLLCYGLEGEDYNKISENRIEPVDGGYTYFGWVLGNTFQSFLLPGQADDIWEQTKKNNDEATPDPLTGFIIDRTNILNEIAQIKALAGQYTPILSNGLDDADKTLAELQEKATAAGNDVILAEIQKQYDNWVKAK